jgi:orotate phosphoribosyltransferase
MPKETYRDSLDAGDAHELLRIFIKRHSIRIVPEGEEFKLSSGQKSRVYCDLKKTVLRADVTRVLSYLLTQAASEFAASSYAGVAVGGCHLASICSANDAGWKNTIYVRKEAKGHGTQNLIDAPDMNKASEKVVLLEDVTTTAGNVQRALKVLKEEGYHVTGVISIVDRREAWTFTDLDDTIDGVPFRAIYRIESLVEGSYPNIE